MYAGILVAMDIKWRLSLPLEQEDDPFDLLRLSRKISLMFPAATVFNLGENQLIYESETHINPNIGRSKTPFCVAMA